MTQTLASFQQWVLGPLTSRPDWAYLLGLRDLARRAGLSANIYADQPPAEHPGEVLTLDDYRSA